MKIAGFGKGKILSFEEIQRLFSEGLQTPKDRALFAVMLFTSCRINEACSLYSGDVIDSKHRVRPYLLIRKSNTKGKLATRTIPVIEVRRHEGGNSTLFFGGFFLRELRGVDDCVPQQMALFPPLPPPVYICDLSNSWTRNFLPFVHRLCIYGIYQIPGHRNFSLSSC